MLKLMKPGKTLIVELRRKGKDFVSFFLLQLKLQMQ